MPTTSWRKNTSVIKQLTDNPGDFSFRQAVRLLERSSAFRVSRADRETSNPIARFLPPQTEFVRIKSRQSFGFPASEIGTVKPVMKGAKLGQWQISINLIGLTGSNGILPYHYTETLLKRNRAKDHSMEDFFNIFNHRVSSLFFQASTKYNFPVEYERGRLNKDKSKSNDSFTQGLLSLIGLGTSKTNNRLYTRDESLVYYAGLFTQKTRTSTGLKQIIKRHFSIAVEIREFIGQWQELIDDVRTRLPGRQSAGQNNQLGKNLMLGRKGWFAQGKIRIILGPLSKEQFYRFAPGTVTLKALNEIVRLYIGLEHDHEFVMLIRRSEIPERIQLGAKTKPVIGWNTWLSGNGPDSSKIRQTIEIPVSVKQLS